MANYDRYKEKSQSEKKYNRRGLSYWMMRHIPDKTIKPYLEKIEGESVLEVGVGYGYYKKQYFDKNTVIGYDVNPFLGKNLGIEIIEGRAGDIAKVSRKFDRVMSFFMTEYLDTIELEKFINDSCDALLEKNGVFVTTVIVDQGLGTLYTRLARAKGIQKYSYSYKDLEKMLHGRNYRFIRLDSYLHVPFATLIEIKK